MKAFCKYGLMFIFASCIFIYGAFALANDVLTLPASLQTIDDEAFYGSTSIGKVVLPDNVKEIRTRAFANSSVTEINLPDSLEYIAEDAFDGSDNVIMVANPGTYAYDWAVDHHYINPDFSFVVNSDGTLTGYIGSPSEDIVIPNEVNGVKVTAIGNGAFSSCSLLKTVSIPEGVMTIGNRAFWGCENLIGVYLPNGLMSIGGRAFGGCVNLKSIHLPDSITTLYSEVFDGCENLSTVNYPKSWIKKETYSASGNGPFTNCPKLISIDIPEGVISIPDNAFVNTASLTYVGLPSTLKTIGNNAFYLCPQLIQLYMMILPEGLNSIGSRAFSYCGLSTVYLPSSLKYISNDAFGNGEIVFYCYVDTYALEWCGNNKKNFTIQEFDLYNPEDYPIDPMIKLQWYSCNTKEGTGFAGVSGCSNYNAMTDIVIPSYYSGYVSPSYYYFTVNRINSGAFSSKRNIRSVYIPSTVTEIGTRAFYWCYDLVAIYIPDSVTSIGSEVFDGEKDRITVYGRENSYVDDWCSKNGIRFVPYNVEGSEQEDDELICIDGLVKTGLGIGLPNVSITLVNENDEIIGFTYTDKDGKWFIDNLQANQYATIYYSLNGYSISDNGNVVLLTEQSITSVATIDSQENSNISFTMTQNGKNVTTIVVGTTINFNVTAQDAECVRLVVDGVAYEQYSTDSHGNVSFDRRFTKSGMRSVQIQAFYDGEWNATSSVKMIEIITDGVLETPNIHDIGVHLKGNDLTIIWDSVEHADSYKVYLYHDYEELWSQDSDGAHEITIPGAFFPISSNYSVDVIAYGKGYDQITTTKLFTVGNTENVTIIYPHSGAEYVVGDTMHISIETNVDKKNVKMLVTSLLDESDRQLMVADETGTFTPIAKTIGQYEITPYYFDDLATTDGICAGETVVVSVRSPRIIVTESENKIYSYYADSDQKSAEFSITADPGCVVNIYLNEELIDQVEINNADGISWCYDRLTSEGLYDFKFAISKDNYEYFSTVFPVYIYRSTEQTNMYLAQTSSLYGCPGEQVRRVLNTGTTFTVCGYWGQYAYGRESVYGEYGFVPYEVLSETNSSSTSTIVSYVSTTNETGFAFKNTSYEIAIGVVGNVENVSVEVHADNTIFTVPAEPLKYDGELHEYVARFSVDYAVPYSCLINILDVNGVTKTADCQCEFIGVQTYHDQKKYYSRYIKVPWTPIGGLSSSEYIPWNNPADYDTAFVGTFKIGFIEYYVLKVSEKHGGTPLYGYVDERTWKYDFTTKSTDQITRRGIVISNLMDTIELLGDGGLKNGERMANVFNRAGLTVTSIIGRSNKYIIINEVNEVFKDIDYNDVTYIYIGSHGCHDKEDETIPAKSWALYASNGDFKTQRTNGDLLYSDIGDFQYGSTDEQHYNSHNNRGFCIYFIIDSCYSGAFAEYVDTDLGSSAIMSTKPNEQSPYINDSGYLFTKNLATYLLGCNGDVSIDSILETIPSSFNIFFLSHTTQISPDSSKSFINMN